MNERIQCPSCQHKFILDSERTPVSGKAVTAARLVLAQHWSMESSKKSLVDQAESQERLNEALDAFEQEYGLDIRLRKVANERPFAHGAGSSG